MSTLRPIALATLCVLVSGCSYPHAGPTLPDGATSADEASPTPPPVLVTQSPLPSASPSYPTGHPSLKPSYAGTKNSPSPTSATSPAVSDVAVVSSSNNPGAVDPGASSTSQDAAPLQSATSANVDSDSNFDNLDVVDPGLKTKLGILRVGSDQGENNLLSVFAGLKNKTSRPLALEVQTIYKDKDGAPLNDGSWIPMTLKPHEDTEYRSSSISAEAVDFVVRIRRASDNAAGSN